MLRILNLRRYVTCLLLGAGMLWSCDTEIVFEPKFATPTCSDGIKNHDEKGIDCGSTKCGPCFAIFEVAPCAATVRIDKLKLNQDEYSVDYIDRYSYGSADNATFTVHLTQNGYGAGKLNITIANHSYLKKSTVYTLDQAEANPDATPFYHKAKLEYFPPYSGYASTSSKGKLYVEVANEEIVFTICDVLLNNSVNFNNTYMASGKIAAETY